jgi:ribosomal protein L37AE/L43A
MAHPEDLSPLDNPRRRERQPRRRLMRYIGRAFFVDRPRVVRRRVEREPESEWDDSPFRCPDCGSDQVRDEEGGGMSCDECGYMGADREFQRDS